MLLSAALIVVLMRAWRHSNASVATKLTRAEEQVKLTSGAKAQSRSAIHRRD
jgi:hypothetical protein